MLFFKYMDLFIFNKAMCALTKRKDKAMCACSFMLMNIYSYYLNQG